jgi:hypothetical protein
MAYQFDVWIDPVIRPEGNMQVDPGFAFGLASTEAEPNPHRDPAPKIAVSVREGLDRGFWSVFIDGVNVSANPPDKGNHNNGEFQQPFVFAPHPGAYHMRVVCAPAPDQTRLRFFFDDMYRPAEEHLVPRNVLPGHVGFYALIGGQEEATETVRFERFAYRTLSVEDALREPMSAEAVMAALDRDHPALAEVRQLHEGGDTSEARAAFLRHMRERCTPPGAPLDSEFLYGNNYREIADESLRGRYGTKGFFPHFPISSSIPTERSVGSGITGI